MAAIGEANGNGVLAGVEESRTWNTQVRDETTGKGEGDDSQVQIGGYDAEVIELRPANPIGPGYLPLAASTPVTFDHATVTNANNMTYPFAADVPSATIPVTCIMLNTAGTKVIAVPSQPNSDSSGFTVQDGKTAPPPPKL